MGGSETDCKGAKTSATQVLHSSHTFADRVDFDCLM